YPINSVPVVVEISFVKDETLTIKDVHFAGKKTSEPALDVERTDINHFTVLHHYPTQAQIKDGYQVIAPEGEYEPPSKTTYIAEAGSFHFKKTQEAVVINLQDFGANMSDKIQDGNKIEEKGIGSLKHPSEVEFYKGNSGETPYFSFISSLPNQ